MDRNLSQTESLAEEFISSAVPASSGLSGGIKASLLRGRDMKRNEPEGLHFDVHPDWPQLIEAFKTLVPPALSIAKFVLDEWKKGVTDSKSVCDQLSLDPSLKSILDKISKEDQISLIKAVLDKKRQ